MPSSNAPASPPVSPAPRGDFLDGSFVRPRAPDGALAPVSPADLRVALGVYETQTGHAALAVDAARRALPAWRRAPQATRTAALRAFGAALDARRERFAHAIAHAIGKPLWEARTEAAALVAKVQLTLDEGLALVAARALGASGPEVAALRYRPVGVCAVLGPFNFPAHLPNGHLVPALALGNTVVLKPSERAPEVGELFAECALDAGLPPGVFNVLQGGADVSAALVAERDLDAVFFTGSTAVGKKLLAASAEHPGRLLALELGGSNTALVFDDANLAHAARELAFSAFVTAGQRCTATARVYAHRAVFDELAERLAYAASRCLVGAPFASPEPLLGPVLSRDARDRALALATHLEATHRALAPLRALDDDPALPPGYYLRPGVYALAPGRSHADDPRLLDERFAPLLTLEALDDDEAAVTAANAGAYGLAAAVFTASRERFERAADELAVGVCNWNRGTVGSSSRLPFGGVKSSGNHRAAGLFSALYCVDPVARLEVAEPREAPAPPGLALRP